MKTAKLEQKGRNLGALVVGGLAILWLLRNRGGTTDPAPGGGGAAPLGEVSDFNVRLSNPIDKEPGQIAGMSGVSFRYKGPRQDLLIGWGIKTEGGSLFGIPLVDPRRK